MGGDPFNFDLNAIFENFFGGNPFGGGRTRRPAGPPPGEDQEIVLDLTFDIEGQPMYKLEKDQIVILKTFGSGRPALWRAAHDLYVGRAAAACRCRLRLPPPPRSRAA